MIAPGAKLNARYEILSVLGEGGMGRVYLASDAVLGGKKVALKSMAIHFDRAEERERAVRQFRTEAHLLASLDHPGLVTVTDYFEDESNAYLVMALVDGTSLETRREVQPPSVDEVRDWTLQLCDVLEYLHQHEPPVLFRDLKPANIMLDGRGRIRLIDFGIARTLESGQETSTFLKGAGTASFAPLEQFGALGTDQRADIYALGATMYVLLTGQLPPISVDRASAEVPVIKPSTLRPSVSEALDAVVLKAMALGREDRYQSVAQLRNDLLKAPSSATRPLPEEGSASTRAHLPSPSGPTRRSGDLSARDASPPSAVDLPPQSPPVAAGPAPPAPSVTPTILVVVGALVLLLGGVLFATRARPEPAPSPVALSTPTLSPVQPDAPPPPSPSPSAPEIKVVALPPPAHPRPSPTPHASPTPTPRVAVGAARTPALRAPRGSVAWKRCQEQMLGALDVARSSPPTRPGIVRHLRAQLEQAGTSDVEDRIRQLRATLDRALRLTPVEFRQRRHRMAEHMTIVFLKR